MTRRVTRRPVVLKLGGELLDASTGLPRLAVVVARLAAAGPLVVVHGGGREVDAALVRQGLSTRAVDGLRITGEAELPTVVAILAGLVNTRLVAALGTAGVRAVGLTGADDRLGPVAPAAPHQRADGTLVGVGLVGEPIGTEPPRLLLELCGLGCVPVVASIGIMPDAALYNVNADTLAASLAARLGAPRLVIAGATTGVLGAGGRALDRLERHEIDDLIAAGTVHSGMIAKLRACRMALDAGVPEVLVVDGRQPADIETGRGTCVVALRPEPAAPGLNAGEVPPCS